MMSRNGKNKTKLSIDACLSYRYFSVFRGRRDADQEVTHLAKVQCACSVWQVAGRNQPAPTQTAHRRSRGHPLDPAETSPTR
jgi:hypothetical protein